MAYLLDTHIFLWALNEPEKLSNQHRQIIENSSNKIVVSYFSYLEIAIKQKLGKLDKCDLKALGDYAEKKEFIHQSISLSHIQFYENLTLMQEHRDPFDRFIISTACVENMKLITVDSKFQLYKDFVEII